MNRIKRIAMAVAGLTVAGAGVVMVPTAAQAVCDDYGTHYSAGGSSLVFLAGSYERTYVDPGVSYTISTAESTSTTGTLSTSVGANFYGVVSAQIGYSVADSTSVSLTESWTYTNNNSYTEWVQLGNAGREFDYRQYDVDANCNVTSDQTGHAILPTNEAYASHGPA